MMDPNSASAVQKAMAKNFQETAVSGERPVDEKGVEDFESAISVAVPEDGDTSVVSPESYAGLVELVDPAEPGVAQVSPQHQVLVLAQGPGVAQLGHPAAVLLAGAGDVPVRAVGRGGQLLHPPVMIGGATTRARS